MQSGHQPSRSRYVSLRCRSLAAGWIGPGAGLSALGTLVALVGAFFMLLAGFVWYPVKRLLRRRGVARGAEAARQPAAGTEARE